jgi:hypothetical protein
MFFCRPVSAQVRDPQPNNQITKIIKKSASGQEQKQGQGEENSKSLNRAPKPSPRKVTGKGVKHILGKSQNQLDQELANLKRERFYEKGEKFRMRMAESRQESRQNVVKGTSETSEISTYEIQNSDTSTENEKEVAQLKSIFVEYESDSSIYEVDQEQLLNNFKHMEKLLITGGFLGAGLVGNGLKNLVFSKLFNRKKNNELDNLLEQIFENTGSKKKDQNFLNNIPFVGFVGLLLVIFIMPIKKKKPSIFGTKTDDTTIAGEIFDKGKKTKEKIFPPEPTLSENIQRNFFFLLQVLSKHYPRIIVVMGLTALMHPGIRSFISNKTPQLVFVEKAFATIDKMNNMLNKIQGNSIEYMKSISEYFRKAQENFAIDQRDSLKASQKSLEKLNVDLTSIKVDNAIKTERLESCTNSLRETTSSLEYWQGNYNSMHQHYDKVRVEYSKFKDAGGNLLANGNGKQGQLGYILDEISKHPTAIPIIGQDQKKKTS